MKKLFFVLCFSLVSVSIMIAQPETKRNLTKIMKNGLFGYIDENGNIVVPTKFVRIGEFDEANHPVRGTKDKYENWGYVDCYGKDVTTFDYFYACPFYDEDLALVCKSFWDDYDNSYNRFGYINTNGKIVISISYKKAFPFSEGLAAVKRSNEEKFGFIDKQENAIIDFQFDSVKWGFTDGFVWVMRDKKWGMINKSGRTKVDFQYSTISNFDPETGFADAVTSQKIVHYYDAKGNKYNSAKAREEANNKIPRIEWPYIPSTFTEPQFALIVQIKSDSKIEYCNLYLNGEKVASFQDQKSSIFISQVLSLNKGSNQIIIEVKNLGGVTKESKIIEYKELIPINKPVIAINDLPSEVASASLTVTAEITSESEITGCNIYLKESYSAPGGSYRAPDIIENKKKTISKTLNLREGRNIIVVEATNNAGTSKKESIVNYVKPVPPTISWIGKISDKTTKPQFTVEASINSKSDVRWNISMISTGKTKGGIRTPDIVEIANGNGGNAKSVVTLKPGYNTITVEAINAFGKKTESKTIWYSPCEKRIALVIGNKNYYAKSGNSFGECPLSRNDADTIAKLLENECGFINVVKVLDANYQKMGKVINDFIDTVKMRNYETAFIYYSGHGISFSNEEGDNYLIPIDCSGCKQEVITKGFDIKAKIIDRLSKEAPNCSVKIAMLDCCRSNDYYDCNLAPGSGGTKGAIKTKGLREMEIPEGISIWYAAEFEHLANVGKGPNSPFVECFVKYFRLQSDANWPTMCDQVSRNVKDMTKKDKDMVEQYPIFDTRHMKEPQNFYLNPYHDKPY